MPSDQTRVMAGDALLVNPTYSGTMVVIVNAEAISSIAVD